MRKGKLILDDSAAGGIGWISDDDDRRAKCITAIVWLLAMLIAAACWFS